jgi:aspartyl-tRNA(Asn)/glutamyl-tRNA(Gln) amidotransferase subunit A
MAELPLATASMAELARALRRRTVSPVELFDAYRERAQRKQELQAFITLPDERARREAKRAQQRLARREAGPLLGVPIAIKDLFDTRGIRTTAGSRILRNRVPLADAAAVTRLRAAGVVIFGKTNLHEFAYGVSNANPWWGIARNPRDPQRSPGGSSGGSAIAVVAGLAAAALGSDTGGSIRIPAALCGCVGLKPTYGTVPVEGAMPLGWSLDHVGPLARTVEDAALFFDALAGGRTWSQAKRVRTAGLRVGMLAGSIFERVQPGVARQAEAAARALQRRGIRMRSLTIKEMAWTVATQLVTLRAEASAIHARWLRSRPRAYGPDVRVRLQLGALVNGADYVLAQRMRAQIREALRRAFEEVDLLLLPSTPITAPIIGERTVRWGRETEPVDGALVRFTAPFNLTGAPTLSVPYGTDAGLPVGMQLVGRWHDEARLLAVGRLLEEGAGTSR